MIGVFDDPKRDPRGLISVAYLSYLKRDQKPKLSFEAKEYGWFDFYHLPKPIEFDHNLIIAKAKEFLENSHLREVNKNCGRKKITTTFY